MEGHVPDPSPRARVPRSWLTSVFAVTTVIIAVVAGVLVVLNDGAEENPSPVAVPIPGSYREIIAEAAQSCPMLSTPRLAAQIMTNSGFDPAMNADGRVGIAGLTEEAWQRWLPWPNADRTDPDANITALAHQMCDFAGQLRLARTVGEPWHLALAAHRTTLTGVVSARGVPADAAPYVAQVDRYVGAYADPAAAPGRTVPVDPVEPAATTSAPSPSPSVTPSPDASPSPGQSPSPRPSTSTPRPPATTNPPAPAPTTPRVTGPTGRISGYVGKCIHVAYTNSADNTQIEMYTCNDGPAEVMTMASDGTIRALGKCMDIKDSSTSNGARIVLFTCNGSPSQQWIFTAARDIVNPRANKCLDVLDKLTYDGVPLQLWECNGGAHQKWYVPGS